MIEFRNAFGANFKQIRKEKGLSQEDVSLACDLHRTTVGKIERGEVSVGLDSVMELAEVLNVESKKLFEGVGPKPSTD